MANKIKELLLKLAKNIWTWIIIGVGFILYISVIIIQSIQEKKQIKKNESDIDKIKEKEEKNDKKSDNINNDFNGSPFNRARNKR